jgi:hypothetical protein
MTLDASTLSFRGFMHKVYCLRVKNCLFFRCRACRQPVGAASSRDDSPGRGWKPLLQKRNFQAATGIVDFALLAMVDHERLYAHFSERCGFLKQNIPQA